MATHESQGLHDLDGGSAEGLAHDLLELPDPVESGDDSAERQEEGVQLIV